MSLLNNANKSQRVVVIGGGLAGLSAACVLAGRGYAVTLLDKNAWVGGKAAILEEGGFRFDMGPTILLMPSVLKKIFSDAGRDMNDYLELVRLHPEWRCFFQDGSSLDLVSDTAKMQQNINRLAGESVARGYGQFMQLSEKLSAISDRFFFWRPIETMKDMFDSSNTFNLKTLKDVLALRMWSTFGATVRKHIKDPRVAQMVDHFTQYVGSSPEASPAVLAGIGSMQTSEGIWYPIGGTGAVPRALAKLAIDLGVTIRTRTHVKKILTHEDRTVGVVTDKGETIECGAVVSNSDSVRTHNELLDDKYKSKFNNRRSYEAACSGVVLYLGLNKRYEHIAHHDFVFSRDPHEEFDAIYNKGEPAPDPTAYLCAPAATEAAVAPPGGEALYVLVHTPYLRPGHDWSKMLPVYRNKIIEKLKTTGHMPDIESRIVFEKALTPQDINDRYHVLNGAIYGLASHGRLNGAFKPGNRSPDVRGLYLAGGAAHPGPGMPMVMMSGYIAADALDSDGVVEPVGSNERELVTV